MTERDRIRAKLSDTDKDFLDSLRKTFPGARLRHIRFSDGEEIGRPSTEEKNEN